MATPLPPPLATRPSRARWDAIVVGSGVGGAVTAALLAAAGREVLVVEKNPVPGGILASYRRDGFKIDTGSHLISRGERGPLAQVLRTIGGPTPRFLTHRIPVRSRGIFAATAPTHRRGLVAVARQAVRDLRIPARDVRRLARMMFHVFTLTEWELRRWDRRTLDAFVRRYTEHPGAYFLFSFLASIFFVLPPWQVSAGEAIRCLRWVLRDYRLSYVEGGMDSLGNAMLGRVVAGGGEIVTGARVAAIARDGDRLRVTTTTGDEVSAPAVACNLAPDDLLALLDAGAVPDDWAIRARAVQGSGSAHQLKLALRRPLVDEGCVIGGLSPSGLTTADLTIDLMERTVASIEAGRIADPLALYAPVPTNYDPSLAPPGHQLIVASIYGPIRDDPADPPEAWRDAAIAAIERVIPGLRDELVFAEWTPVPAVARWMGKTNHGAICNAQVPGQVGADRLPVATPVPGLWLCGDGAGGRGIGTELAASSGMEAAREILEAAA
ncbi:MAG: NAD(P)/FAD-dependent oxidoreductase [Kofleriaceae bacterium]|nr:NAD(P)/FAD-dependent oxidoreductase [Kofleriaceae bacterium]